MKKLFVMLALALPLFASAQKIGHINAQEILFQMPEIAQVEDSIAKVKEQFSTEIGRYTNELQMKYADYQKNEATMSQVGKDAAQQELMQLQERIELFQQQAQQELQKMQYEMMQPIQEKLLKAIKDVAEEKGYMYIISGEAMLYAADNANDVSADVKKKLGVK